MSNINGENINQQVTDEVCEEDVREQLIEQRTKLFMDFIAFAEENGVPVDSHEFRMISEFATRDGIVPLIPQKISNLADLQVEELSDKDIALILRRARLGLKRVVEQRAQYAKVLDENGNPTGKTYGPFFQHHTRKHRRYLMSKILKRTKPSSRASEIVKEFKSRRMVIAS